MGQTYNTSAGKKITLDQKLGEGGEGEVWTLTGSSNVAKIYHPNLADRGKEDKLKAMVANQPQDEMWVRYRHTSIAWPTDLLYQGSSFAGFVMPKIGKGATILEMYNPSLRKKACPGFTYKYLIHTALNLSKALNALHVKGYVMGDINEGNVLVTSQALVTVIDTDSFQVKDQNGTVHRCPVGKEEFTPPELQGVHFDQVDRLAEHDFFGLGVLIFHLLMEGFHPFDGILRGANPTSKPAMIYCLCQGAFPYVKNQTVSPPTLAPRFDILPPEIQKFMIRCFVDGYKRPATRPSPYEWSQILEAAESNLKVCKKNPDHLFSNHLKQCVWCEREARFEKARLQKPLRSPQVKASAPASPPASKPASSPLPFQFPTPLSSSQSSPRGLLRTNRWWERLKGSFRSRGLYLDYHIWWSEIRRYALYGGLGGIAFFLLATAMFLYPLVSGYALGIASAALFFTPVVWLTRRYSHSFIRLNRNTIRFSNAILALGLLLSLGGGYGVGRLAYSFLTSTVLNDGWLLFDCAAVGLLGGTAWGNYLTFLKRKSKALAWATSLVLFVLPVFIMWYYGTFDILLIESLVPLGSTRQLFSTLIEPFR